MCGIVGAYGPCSQPLEDFLDRMAHRGPDGRDVQHLEYASLGHARLAIVDLKGGHQPMNDYTGTRWLVCNGEIYNHQTLRAEHAHYPFKTRSDSEAILAVYEQDGLEGISQLDGMFAFALLDGDQLVLARDPLGIKPLYYGSAQGTLYFASEIKALQDIVKQVKEFPPGYWFSTTTGFVPYYSLDDRLAQARSNGGMEDRLAHLRDTLQTSVRKRLMSDVPLGVFLSGGLDSSIISMLVCEDVGSVHSFVVGVEGSIDLQHARQVAKFLGTQHHEYVYTSQEMIAVLPDVIYYLESFDPALVRSAIPNFFLTRLAQDYVTVVLSGEGADELYAGYRYLDRFQTPHDLQQELVEITSELHNRNLQRLDRMTMAHGLEGRVPFLDVEFVEVSLGISAKLKIHTRHMAEKWVLRKAFEGLLPREIVWRPKQKFAEGAGSASALEDVAEAAISDDEFAAETSYIWNESRHQIRSKEELYYYRIFREFFEAPVTALVGRSRSL
jgi:asparagine synthase (glutamine-hydrolysing)